MKTLLKQKIKVFFHILYNVKRAYSVLTLFLINILKFPIAIPKIQFGPYTVFSALSEYAILFLF